MFRLTFLLGLFFCFTTYANNEPAYDKIKLLPDEHKSPAANLTGISWLAGHWRGKALGGVAEELWAPPAGDSLVGAFKLVKDNKVKFYEIMIIRQVENSLIFQLKHFNNDLTGWEEKAETVDFPLVSFQPNIYYFDGLTIELIDEQSMNMYLLMNREADAKVIKFEYHRVK